MRWCNVAFFLCSLFVANTRTNGFDLPAYRSNITLLTSSKTMLKLKWLPPSDTENDPFYYQVHYDNKYVNATYERVIIKGLKPFTNYTINIFDCFETCSQLIGPVTARTKIGNPSPVDNFRMQPVNATALVLTWDPPRTPGGPENFYSVRVVSQNHKVDFNTTERLAYLQIPICSQNETSFFTEVLVNAHSVDYGHGKAVTYKGATSSSVIFHLKCRDPISSDAAGKNFEVKRVFASTNEILLEWTSPEIPENVSSYVVDYNGKSVRVNESEALLRDLTPNTKYNVSILACNVNCTMLTTLSTRTKFSRAEKVENVTAYAYNGTHFRISWEPSLVQNGLEAFYAVCSSSGHREYTADTNVLVRGPVCREDGNNDNLTISVTAMNVNDTGDHLAGDPVTIILLANCSVINNTLIVELPSKKKPQLGQILIRPTSIYLRWTPPEHEIDFYEISSNGETVQESDPEVELLKLVPDSDYNITIRECSDNCSLIFGPLTLRTFPVPVVTVQNLTVSELNMTHIRIMWQPFCTLNTRFSYQLQVDNMILSTDHTDADVLAPSCKNRSHYLVNVTVSTNEIVEPVSVATFVKCPVPASVPHFPAKVCLRRINVSSSAISLEWADAVGENVTYDVTYNGNTVRVQDTSVTVSNLTQDTWYAVKLAACSPNCSVTTDVAVRTNAVAPVVVENRTNENQIQCAVSPNTLPEFHIKKIIVSRTSAELEWNSIPEYAEYLVKYNDFSDRISGKSSILRNMRPNSNYKVEILGCDEHCTSLIDPFTLQTKMDVPISVRNVTATRISDDSFRILWQPPKRLVENFTFLVQVSSGGFTVKEETNRTYIDLPVPVCENKISSFQFEVTVKIINTDADVMDSFIQPTTAFLFVHCRVRQSAISEPKPMLKEIFVTSSWVEFEWNGTNAANESHFVVEWNNFNYSSQDTKIMLTGLLSDTKYQVQIYECSATCRSIIGPFVMHTHVDVPVKVENMTITDSNSTHIRVSWKQPQKLSLPDVRYNVLTKVDQTIHQLSTEDTFVDLAIPLCKENESNLIYKISVHIKSRANLTVEPSVTALTIRCAVPYFYDWTVLCPQNKVVSTGVVLIVGIAAFLAGLAISLLNMKKFSYNYKPHRYM